MCHVRASSGRGRLSAAALAVMFGVLVFELDEAAVTDWLVLMPAKGIAMNVISERLAARAPLVQLANESDQEAALARHRRQRQRAGRDLACSAARRRLPFAISQAATHFELRRRLRPYRRSVGGAPMASS